MADVFVSYKREDKRWADLATSVLRAVGYSFWIDDRLTAKAHWDRLIETEIKAARAVLVLWTPLATESEWVRNEAHYAKDHGKLVQAQCITCDLPLAFRMTQYADLRNWNGSHNFAEWQKLLRWLGGQVGRPPRVAPPPKPATPSSKFVPPAPPASPRKFKFVNASGQPNHTLDWAKLRAAAKQQAAPPTSDWAKLRAAAAAADADKKKK